MPSVQVCIPSRDGKFDDEVLMRAHAACEFAYRNGIRCELARVKDSYNVATCRNRGVSGFLNSQFDSLLFVDDDVLLPQTAVHVLATAVAGRKCILCGCVPSIRIDELGITAGYVQVRPPGRDWLKTWPTEETEAEACGGGCMLIQRELLEAMPFPWFRWPETYQPGRGVRAITDDADFCERSREMGYQVFANPSVRCGHKKTIDVSMLIPADH